MMTINSSKNLWKNQKGITTGLMVAFLCCLLKCWIISITIIQFGNKTRCKNSLQKIKCPYIFMTDFGIPWIHYEIDIISKNYGQQVVHLGKFGHEHVVLEK